MRVQTRAVLSILLFSLIASPAAADGRWRLSLGVGQSVSEGHGSTADAAAYAFVSPVMGLGLETGVSYMKEHERDRSIAFSSGGGAAFASLTDGITRNRAYFLGPALRIGQAFYAVVSGGLYEFSDNSGNFMDTRWGGSAGLGITGNGRFEPRGEIRYRWANDVDRTASAIQFSVGFDFH